jgi:hypothetical protein
MRQLGTGVEEGPVVCAAAVCGLIRCIHKSRLSGNRWHYTRRWPYKRLIRILPHRNCRQGASTRPDYRRRNAIFHRRACIRQIAILKIQLVGHIAVRTAYPAVIKAADDSPQEDYLNSMLHQAIKWGHKVVVWDDAARVGNLERS